MKPFDLEQVLNELDPGRKGKLKFHEVGDRDDARLVSHGIVIPTGTDVSIATASRLDDKRTEEQEELTEARIKVQEWNRKLGRAEQ